jgi:hypothetical protein
MLVLKQLLAVFKACCFIIKELQPIEEYHAAKGKQNSSCYEAQLKFVSLFWQKKRHNF